MSSTQTESEKKITDFSNQLNDLLCEIEKLKLDIKEISMSDLESLEELIKSSNQQLDLAQACYQKAISKITEFPNIKIKNQNKHLEKINTNIEQTKTFINEAKQQITNLVNSKRDLNFTYNNHFKFTNEDYFNIEQLKQLFSNNVTDDKKSDMIKNVLIKYCLVKDNIVYIMLSNFTYYRFDGNAKQMLTTIIGNFLSECVNRLSTEEVTNLKEECGDKCVNLQTGDLAISKYLQRVITKLNTVGNDFDTYEKQIHFKNGYIDVKTGIFNKRNSSFRVRRCNIIERNYKPSTQEQRDYIMQKISQIYPNEEDRECMMLIFGSAISGNGSLLNSMLFIVGMGSTGKSFVLEMIKSAFESYVLTPPSDSLAQGNSKIDKIINNYLVCPHTLITWINEMSHKRIDTDLFKKWTEGYLQSCQLYKEGSTEITTKSLMVTTANQLPNLPQDSGIVRRLRSYEHNSLFTLDEKLVDEKNHIYKREVDLLIKIKQNNLLDAVVDIFISYAQKFLSQKVLSVKLTANFTTTAETITQVNDYIQDFVDMKLTITNEDGDRIARDHMIKFLEEFKPNCKIVTQQLIARLKEKGISYDGQKRCKTDSKGEGLRGCFIGVKLKIGQNNENKESTALITQRENSKLQIELMDKDEEIQNLKQMIKDLQSQLSKNSEEITSNEEIDKNKSDNLIAQIKSNMVELPNPYVKEEIEIVEDNDIYDDDDNDDIPPSCVKAVCNTNKQSHYSKLQTFEINDVKQIDLAEYSINSFQTANNFKPKKTKNNKKKVEVSDDESNTEVIQNDTVTEVIDNTVPFIGEKTTIDDDENFLTKVIQKPKAKPKRITKPKQEIKPLELPKQKVEEVKRKSNIIDDC